MKLKWAKYCVFSATGNDNLYNIVNYNNGDNIILTIKDTKLYVPVVTLSAIDNQKLSSVPSEGCERSFYWSEYKTKSENKTMANEFRYFIESNSV